MAASTARRYETRALLRAHLAASSGYRHLTKTCPVCHHLLRLALERADRDPGAPTPGEPEDLTAGLQGPSAGPAEQPPPRERGARPEREGRQVPDGGTESPSGE
ncbi:MULTISPECIES: DUF6274 family protein [unclassified Streptomyces]|uniref:DUF6274 family protein n=1 Tax=unclassified Streptomyces TaxID=2593676 RepID=UPI0033FB610F